MKKNRRKKALLGIALSLCLILPLLLSCRDASPPIQDSKEALAKSIVERFRHNIDCQDFAFRLKVTRSYPDGKQYAKTFQFYGTVQNNEGKVFAESVSGAPEESSRYLLFTNGSKITRAEMYSAEFGEVELREDEPGLNKMVFGNLSYSDFRYVSSLQPEDFDQITEQAGNYVLQSRVKEPLGDEFEESVASHFVYYIDRESYLPDKVEFLNQRGKFKEFRLEARELVQNRWVIRRARVLDFLDQSETLLEADDIRFDKGVEEKLFTNQNLRTRN